MSFVDPFVCATDPENSTDHVDLSMLPLPFVLTPAADRGNTAHHHLIVPYATVQDARCQQMLQALDLPHLDSLLTQLTGMAVDEGQADDLIPPHERIIARAWGLNTQAPAWAAAASGTLDQQPCAWLTPCHWSAGADQVRMDDPTALALSMEDAMALHALLQPWFAEDGLTLTIEQPLRWRISGQLLAGVVSASLDRVLLRDVRPWLPDPQAARTLHRLHSEVQMLLYTHAFNDARAARGLQPINAFWLHGIGALEPHDVNSHGSRPISAQHIQVLDDLRQAALRQDWQLWQQAWRHADAGPLTQLVNHITAGYPATLTLCSERHARSFTTGSHGWFQKIKGIFRPQRFADICKLL